MRNASDAVETTNDKDIPRVIHTLAHFNIKIFPLSIDKLIPYKEIHIYRLIHTLSLFAISFNKFCFSLLLFRKFRVQLASFMCFHFIYRSLLSPALPTSSSAASFSLSSQHRLHLFPNLWR